MTQLIAALGNYCFPGGKPDINWTGGGVTFSVTYPTDSKVTASVASGPLPETIDILDSLEVTLGIASGNDLWVIDDDSVKVYMGGHEVVGAYNAAQQKVSINNVVGNIIIVANAITYVQDNLVVMFDGKHQGSVANEWPSAYDATKKLTLNGTYTKNTDHVTFGDTDCYGVMTGQTTLVPYGSSTSEAVFSQADAIGTKTRSICMQGNAGSTMIGTTKSTQEPFATQQRKVVVACSVVGGTRPTNLTRSGFLDKLNSNTANYDLLVGVNEVVSISHYGNAFSLNNNALELTYNPDHPNDASYDQLSNVVNVTASGDPHNMDGEFYVGGIWGRQNSMFAPFYGNIYCVRLYSKVLSEAERTQNFKVDKKRFNIS